MDPLILALENDEDFQSVIRMYEEPNLFTIMGDTSREQWHSSFYYWLLNPKSNHQLGTQPLRALLQLHDKKKGERTPYDPERLSEMELDTEKPLTEGNGQVDIFGRSDDLILVIENKVGASETLRNGADPQTNRYYEEYSREETPQIYIYLTAFGAKAENRHFVTITYQEFYDAVIRECLDRTDIPDKTRLVLEQYARAISNPNPFVNGKRSAKYCHYICIVSDIAQRIFRKHERAFEKIRAVMNRLPGERDETSDECVFYHQYRVYLNEILSAAKQLPITPATEKTPTGEALIRFLIEMGYVVPEKTELITTRNGVTYVMQFCITDGRYKCIVGYTSKTGYDGTDDVQCLTDAQGEPRYFDTINAAAAEAEKGADKRSKTSYGPSAGKWKLIRSGRADGEGETISEILAENGYGES